MKMSSIKIIKYALSSLLFVAILTGSPTIIFAHTVSSTSENLCPTEHILLGGQCYDKSSEELFERIKRAASIQDATPSGQCPQDFHYISGKCYKAGTEQYDAVLKQASAAARAREAAAKTFESSVLSPLPQGSISQRVRGYELSIDIPCQPIAGGQCPTITGPASYIARIYQFGLMIVGLLAFASIVYGALKYILSAGSLASLDEAKDQIKQAIFGVILLLGAFIVLYTINPQLVSLREPDVTPVNIDEIIRRGEIAQEQSLGASSGPRGAGGDPLCSAGTYATLKIGLNLSTTSSDLGAKIGEFSCTRCVDGANKQPDGKCQCQTGFVYSSTDGKCISVDECNSKEGYIARGSTCNFEDLGF